MIDITVIVLTKNESKNISRCLSSVSGWVKRIIVLDSFSDDDTVEIAKRFGAEVFFNKFVNYGNQFKYALEQIEHNTKWIFRLDADEEVSIESKNELMQLCKLNENSDVTGIVFKLEITFLGKKLKFGGNYPFKKLCIFKTGLAYMEDREMDEQIIIKNGKIIEMKTVSYHYDFKDLTFWISKHNQYSNRAALDYLNYKKRKQPINKLDRSAKIRRFIKIHFFNHLPLFISLPLIFFYKYILLLGFLDGKPGFYFIFFQIVWYRTLVNAKIYEIKTTSNNN